MSDEATSTESEVTESETVVETSNGERYASLQANNSGEEVSEE
jgi:hypothetical protein